MARTVKLPDVRKAEFIEAAQQVFMQKGYYATSVEDIANAVGVAKGLFYYYFKSKEDMMIQMVDEVWDEAEKEYWELVETEGLTAIEKFILFSAMRRDKKAQSLFFIEVYEREPSSPLLDHLRTVAYSRLIPLMTRMIEQGVEEGVFDVPYPREAAEFLLRGSEVSDTSVMNDKEAVVRMFSVMVDLWERVLGADKGTFSQIMADSDELFDKVAEKMTKVHSQSDGKRTDKSGG
jgi:AcrR family transcriptional regulator